MTETITVLAAASLTETFEELAQGFESDNPGTSVQLSFGSSTALALQVNSGADADVLATADVEAMTLALENQSSVAKPVIFAHNDLVIAVAPGNPHGIKSLPDLTDPALLISLCAPTVPCGKLTDKALEADQTSLPNASRAPNVKAAIAPLIAGQVDAALVYRTDVMASFDGIEIVDLAPKVLQETDYPIVALGSPAVAEAQAFVDYITSAKSAKILTGAGFRTP